MSLDRQTLLALPKVELHCHLDGSVAPELLFEAARRERLVADDLAFVDFLKQVRVPAGCRDLAQYLECFALPCDLLKQADILEESAYRLVLEAAAEQVVYLELRYAPHLLLGQMSAAETVEAILRGFRRAEALSGTVATLILCALRGLDEDPVSQNELLDLAVSYREQGVCAVDLAGNEAAFPLARYRTFFAEAARRSLPFTIHAGECGEPEEVRLALELGCRRLGHGLAAVRAPELLRAARAADALFELCPLSNLQTRAWPDLNNYPLEQFRLASVPFSFNTDNRTVSGTSLTDELVRLSAGPLGNWSASDFLEQQKTALQHAFLPEARRKALSSQLII